MRGGDDHRVRWSRRQLSFLRTETARAALARGGWTALAKAVSARGAEHSAASVYRRWRAEGIVIPGGGVPGLGGGSGDWADDESGSLLAEFCEWRMVDGCRLPFLRRGAGEEAAARFGRSPRAVKARVHRERSRLRGGEPKGKRK